MSDSPTTPTRREYLVGRIFSLYADLGWAVPTSIEYARLTLLEDTVATAVHAVESRDAKWYYTDRDGNRVRRRPIDVYEDEICAVLDAVEYEGVSFVDAVRGVAPGAGLTDERLTQLARTWCAIAGIKVPA